MLKLGTKKETFEFEYDGKVYTLPSINSLPAKDMLALSRIQDESERVTAGTDLQISIIEKHCKGLLDKLTMDELNSLVTAWSEESGISVGE